jgi:hypothetical protein
MQGYGIWPPDSEPDLPSSTSKLLFFKHNLWYIIFRRTFLISYPEGHLRLHTLQEEILYLKEKRRNTGTMNKKSRGMELHANLNEYCCRKAWLPSAVVPVKSETLFQDHQLEKMWNKFLG